MFAMIISNLIKFFIPLGMLVWAFFMPRIAAYTYSIIYVLFAGYIFIIDKLKPNPDSEKWSSEEI